MSLTKVTYSMISGAAYNVLDFGAVRVGGEASDIVDVDSSISNTYFTCVLVG